MHSALFPKKLTTSSHIRVIAPSRSMAILSQESVTKAVKRLEAQGFTISFGSHVSETDEFNSSSVQSRVKDIHEAFQDKSVDAILTAIGGYNSNQLLEYLDYDLIARNPKIFCGFSDATTLANAVFAKTGLVTYVGPHFSSWAMEQGFEYSQDHFLKVCAEEGPCKLSPSIDWSDDPWYVDQINREFIKNEGHWILNEGTAKGTIIGGHLRCINSLQGTEYWPSLVGSILIIEDDAEIFPALFDRQLQALIHQRDFSGVQGLVIGRFQKDSRMSRAVLEKIIQSKPILSNIPVIANANLGHTTPIATFPIGGVMEMNVRGDICDLEISKH